MKEIFKVTHDAAVKNGDLVNVENFPFFDVAGIQVIKVFATPTAIKAAGDMYNLSRKALSMSPDRFGKWNKPNPTNCSQFKFYYGFEIRNDDKAIKIITILHKDESE